MSTFSFLLDALCSTHLNIYDILFLGVHCCFLDEGFVLQPSISKTSKSSEVAVGYGKNTAVNPIQMLEDGSVVRMILPPNWNLSNPLDQNFSMVYFYPPMIENSSIIKDFLEVHLKAVVVGEKLAVHVVDANNSDSLITAVLSFGDYITSEIVTHLSHRNEAIGQMNEQKNFAFAACMDSLYNKIYSATQVRLIKKFKERNNEPIKKTANDKSDSETVPDDLIRYPAIPIPLREPPIGLFEPDGELMGPKHPAFRMRNPWDKSNRNRQPVIRFDPFNPIPGSGDPDPDGMPNLGNFPHIL